jgi:hypothetical protein
MGWRFKQYWSLVKAWSLNNANLSGVIFALTIFESVKIAICRICPKKTHRSYDTMDSGFVITHTVCNTLSNGKKIEFSVMRIDDHSVSLVFGINF